MVRRIALVALLLGLGATLAIRLLVYEKIPDIGPAQIVPAPMEIKQAEGYLSFTKRSRIWSSDSQLRPLLTNFADELQMLTGYRLEIGRENPEAANIALNIDLQLEREEYVLEIGNQASIRGGSYNAVAMGSVSFLQLLDDHKPELHFPRIYIHDRPQAAYRGLLVDLARQWHSIDTLKQLVLLCRWYKINHMQLHLTDSQSFTFPSQSFPDLPTPDRSYTLDELRELEQFARERGIILIPELDVPGHARAMVAAMPELFGIKNLRRNRYTINMGKEEVYTALDTLIGEMAEVFVSSPYFHIGGDEAYLGYMAGEPDIQAYMRKHKLENVDELYRHFIVRLNEIVKKHGKQTMLWEGFRSEGEVEIPRDIIVFAWETRYQLPQDLLENGYTIINASWKPGYVIPTHRWDPKYIYGWNMFRWENWWDMAPSYIPIQLEPHERIIGGQMCAWEMREEMEIPSLRNRLPSLGERLWAHDKVLPYPDFFRRWVHADRLLQRLICPVRVLAEGRLAPDYIGPYYNKENWFGETLKLTIRPTAKKARIHYTLDGTVPTWDSPRWHKTLKITDTTDVRFQVFDRTGQPLGHRGWMTFEHRPLSAEIEGLLMHLRQDRPTRPRYRFGDSLRITLHSGMPQGRIHYTLNGREPKNTSPVYTFPLKIYNSRVVKAKLFTEKGESKGETWERAFSKVNYEENLTTFKPVTASEFYGGHLPEDAVDGVVDRTNYWWAEGESPQWLKIDLEKTFKISEIHVFPYWDYSRYYQYVVEISPDNQKWLRIGDKSQNRRRASPRGDVFRFDPVAARYIRVIMLKNSADNGFHLVEVRAYAEE